MIRYDWQNVMNEKENLYYINTDYPDYSHRQCDRLTLGNGISLSIQASHTHYCSPRKTVRDYNQYSHFEIGFPSVKIDSLMQFAEDEEDPTGTVYARVPKEIIDEIISKYGGVALEKQLN